MQLNQLLKCGIYPLRVVSCGLTAGVAVCVLTILFSGSIVIYIMAGLTVLTTPHSIYKEKRLMEAPCEYLIFLLNAVHLK
jgi:hypothetical protein